MDADFNRAIAVVLRDEGGLVDDPADPGGLSNFGISLRAYPRLGRSGILALTRAGAEAIYKAEWWDRYRFGLLPWPTCAKVFDLAVNIGPVVAVRMLQAACESLGRQLGTDGEIGPETVSAVEACDPTSLHQSLCAAAAFHYRMVVTENPALARFLKGWLTRAAE